MITMSFCDGIQFVAVGEYHRLGGYHIYSQLSGTRIILQPLVDVRLVDINFPSSQHLYERYFLCCQNLSSSYSVEILQTI